MNLSFQKQPVMRTVLYSLIPVILASIYFFGWVCGMILLLSVLTCTLTEWLLVRARSGKVTEAAWVTAVLFGLSLPPTVPWFMVVVGAAFSIIFAKMAFGGFGMNIFNPALSGRAFIYIAFPTYMSNRWVPAADWSAFPGGMLSWSMPETTLTSATPLIAMRDGIPVDLSYWKLLLGNINGSIERMGESTLLGGGSLGEGSALLILIGGLFLLAKKISNWRVVTAFFGGILLFSGLIYGFDPAHAPTPLFCLLSGGVMLGGFYMITDPVSSARTIPGQWIYGGLTALFTVLIRTWSLFPEGMMFAVLLGNMFNPIIDYSVKMVSTKS
ncbi:MAG: RnfABCDGE type electron transport complex subunit D [Candidatus Delongbacteria bacterium]|nr:RnfABCDGE type electron transport complex subunit D [Candidatus Delongbacteria bacterium]